MIRTCTLERNTLEVTFLRDSCDVGEVPEVRVCRIFDREPDVPIYAHFHDSGGKGVDFVCSLYFGQVLAL